MKKITFFVHYDTYNDLQEKRNYAVSAKNKVDYIIECLNNIGYKVKIVSASESLAEKGFFRKRVEHIGDNTIILFSSFGAKNKITKIIRKLLINLNLLFYIIFNIKKSERVMVYHSLEYIWIYKFLKKIKKINFILEVEEIYSDISSKKFISREKEIKYIYNADKFIFITEIIQQCINIKNKHYCITHGTYKVEKQICDKFEDRKVHIVYSGIIDQEKKGAFTALEICKYLGNEYILNIIGFGNEANINQLNEKIVDNNKKYKCKAIYDGLKKGNEYIEYIQKCHIGLSTQEPTGKYNETSFPSKILAYLSNGLRVVSVDIPAIKTSDVGNILYYYKNNEPKEIAKVIKNIDLNKKYDSRKLISKLDKKFCKDLQKMLGEGDNNE